MLKIIHNKTLSLKLIGALISGGAFALTTSIEMLHSWNDSFLIGVLLSLILFVFFTVLFYAFLFQIEENFLINLEKRHHLRVIFSALILLIVGIYLNFALEFRIQLPESSQSLSITATGDKNSKSQGNEVRIIGLYREDGTQVDFSEFHTVQGIWEKKDGQLIAYQKFPAALNWNGTASGNMRLVFVAHPWSGEVQINWNGKKQNLDLYLSPGTPKPIELSALSNHIENSNLYYLLMLGANSVTLGSLVLFFLMVLDRITNRNIEIAEQSVKGTGNWIKYSIPMIGVWSIWLLAFWPGLMNEDSMSQWGQVATGKFVDAFPAAHTIMLWFITRIWNSPAAVVCVQIVFLSIVVAWGLGKLNKYGVKPIFLWGISFLFALSPVNSVSIITLWKDIPYATALLGLTIALFDIVLNKGNSFNKLSIFIFISFSMIIALFRFNGIPVVILLLIALIILFRDYWKYIIAILITVILLFFIIRGPVYQLFNVSSAVSDLTDGLLDHHLAAYVKYFQNFTPEEKVILNQVSDMGNGWKYDCYLANITVFDEGFNHDMATKDRIKLYEIYFHSLIQNPLIEIRHTLCVGSIVWKIRIPTDGYLYHTFLYYWSDGNPGNIKYILANDYGIKESSSLLWLQNKLFRLVNRVSVEPLKSIIWSPGLYQLFAIMFVLIAGLRTQNKRYWVILLPLLLQSGILMICNVAQDFRYQYGIYLIGIFSVGLLFIPKQIIHTDLSVKNRDKLIVKPMVNPKKNQVNIAVVIPAYRASSKIQRVLSQIPDMVSMIIIVDDFSPDDTGQIVLEAQKTDPRIMLISNDQNQGVGGAMLVGYRASYENGADIIVKVDSDDQMDLSYLFMLVQPILDGKADYVKGNRFLHGRELIKMPFIRRIGNLGLSFLTKLASGYWNIFDPTNGYTAIRSSIIPLLNIDHIDNRYFFETSMLIELGILRAVVKDINIPARYGNETSSLSELKSLTEFPPKLFIGLIRRILFLYFLRDFTAVSVFLSSGSILFIFGFVWGVWHWIMDARLGVITSTGTVMIATLPIIVSVQLVLQAIVLDIQNTPLEIIDQYTNFTNQK